jgi:hypothetical protein
MVVFTGVTRIDDRGDRASRNSLRSGACLN